MIAVGVAEVVGVVLDEEYLRPAVELIERLNHNPLAGRLVGHHFVKGAALGRRVFEMAGVDVQSAAVEEESAVAGSLAPLSRSRIDYSKFTGTEDLVLYDYGRVSGLKLARARKLRFGPK